jgi:hypothetical protein
MQNANKTPDSKRAWLTALAITLAGGVWAVVCRLLPHWPNCTPAGALCLFAGARLRLWQALVVLVVVMAASDLLLWAIFSWKPFDPYVYGCFLLNVLLGRLFLRSGGPWRVPVVSLVASLLFFAVTNFGVWASGDGSLYPKTLTGLGACYIAALPFTGNGEGTPFFFGTVAGDLGYTVLFFGLYAAILFVLERRKASLTA